MLARHADKLQTAAPKGSPSGGWVGINEGLQNELQDVTKEKRYFKIHQRSGANRNVCCSLAQPQVERDKSGTGKTWWTMFKKCRKKDRRGKLFENPLPKKSKERARVSVSERKFKLMRWSDERSSPIGAVFSKVRKLKNLIKTIIFDFNSLKL
ncbi:hypothetical protein ZHAS_00002213 [Anopheles sinensis]|uniref:Uncharacterized protein n=1 Tax=Anopheles sinensis TaxID=74873 RepID=A0A084VBX7_ANOSI|nr:hypothetical protein ZHAS_00002213 [Anopheles sinensis]